MQKLYGDSGNEHNHQCFFDGLFVGDDLVVDFDHLLGHLLDIQARTGDEDGAGQVQQILRSNWQNDAYRPAVGNSEQRPVFLRVTVALAFAVFFALVRTLWSTCAK